MALKSVKMAVFAPMPSASVTTATAVNAGSRRSIRSPKRMSCQNIVATESYIRSW
jgi:hypothetical protein